MCHRQCVRHASIGCEHQLTAADPSNCYAAGGRGPFKELAMRLMIIVQGRWISVPGEPAVL
jgi:hypothetical protein